MQSHRLRAAREALPSRRVPGTHATREEVAELVARWVEQHDDRESAFDANHLGKLERGAVRRPGPLVRAALCSVLDATEHDLGFTATPAEQRVAAAHNGHHTDPAALDAVASTLASLRRLEDATSASEVAPSVRHQVALSSRLATNARADVRPHAVGLLSELEQYLGWLAIPMERWADSRQHLDRAAVLALEAGDPLRLANALSFSAYRALRRNDLRTADALNEAAARDDRVHPALRCYITFQRAEVLAKEGARADAVHALSRADELVELIDTDNLPETGYWYTPEFFLGQRAFVLDALGDAHTASRTAAESLAAMPEAWQTAEWAGRRRALAQLGERGSAG